MPYIGNIFAAGTLDGGTFTQDDIAAKDVTVLNFWALTCPPCIAEMPEIAAFEQALPDNVAMVTVCLDGYGNEDSVNEVLDQAGFEGDTLISGDGNLLDLAGNLMYTPTTVLADSGGALVGEAIIGGQADLAAAYLEAVNQALAAAVLLLPVFLTTDTGIVPPLFCKYLCPAGTLEGGVPLLLSDPNLRKAAGALFSWKTLALAIILIASGAVSSGFACGETLHRGKERG